MGHLSAVIAIDFIGVSEIDYHRFDVFKTIRNIFYKCLAISYISCADLLGTCHQNFQQKCVDKKDSDCVTIVMFA